MPLRDRAKDAAKAYGVYDEAQGAARPAYFLVDGTGKIVWSQTAPPEAPLDLDGLVSILGETKK